MKILIFFTVMFVMAECNENIDKLRYRQELTTFQIRDTMIQSSNKKLFRAINGEKHKHFNSSSFKVDPDNPARKKIQDVKNNLDNIADIFIERSFGYIIKNLHLHLKYSLALIKNMDNEIDKTELATNFIRLAQDQDHCIMSYIYDYGKHDVENVLEAIVYLKLFPKSEFSLINTELSRLNDKIQKSDHFNHISDWENSMADLKYQKSEEAEKWLIIKENIYRGSRTFCSTDRSPLIGKDIFVKEKIFNDMFMEHIFVTEVCDVDFKDDNESFLPESLHPGIPSVEHRIYKWNCSKILDSKEYTYQSFEKEENLGKLLQTIFSLKDVDTSKSYQINFIRQCKKFDQDAKVHNLQSLHNALEKDIYYLNFMKFDNIVAEVMLFVAIKEGRKIFKGIKHTILSCKSVAGVKDVKMGIAILELKIGRTALLGFNYHFDGFINTMLQMRRIDLRKNDNFIAFVKLARNLILLLDMPEADYKDPTKVLIEKLPELIYTLRNIPEQRAAITTSPLKLRNAYMFHPVLNIRKLNQYVSNVSINT